VCARTGRNTYRTFLVHDLLVAARRPGYRPTTVPIRALLGIRDPAIPVSMTASETARADDYSLETVDAGHFVVDERPDLLRKKLIALADETAHA
jgi:pimeloyl-ACP methyl ester carboxylesterase